MTNPKHIRTTEVARTYEPPARKKWIGLRRSALGEIALSLAILLLLDFFVFHTNRYWDVNPHPFLFVTLFIAGKYGTREALVAALACSVALLIGNIPPQTIKQDGYAYALYILKFPIMWLVTAVVFGELRQMHITERNRLEGSLKESEEREQYISQSYQWVRDLKDQMELRMAGQLRSAISAYQAARTMENLSPSEVLRGLEDLVRTALHPTQFSIYLLSPNGLELTLSHGWPEEDTHAKYFGPDARIYQSIVAKQEVLCVANVAQEQLLSGQGILAGPLMDRESGEVVGMLKIEKMGFSDLHLSNIEAFSTICEWAGMAIVNARRYQKTKSQSMVNPDHNMLTHSYMQRYTDYIKALGRRVGFDVSMLTVRLDTPDQFTRATHIRIAHALTDAVNDVLRTVDLAFDYQEKEGEYAIVLPATNRAGAEVVLNKIRGALVHRVGEVARDAALSFTIQMIYEKGAA